MIEPIPVNTAMTASTTQLNVIGTDLADIDGVHAVTAVTGFGLLGHALEMARGSNLAIVIEADAVPLLDGVEALARETLPQFEVECHADDRAIGVIGHEDIGIDRIDRARGIDERRAQAHLLR